MTKRRGNQRGNQSQPIRFVLENQRENQSQLIRFVLENQRENQSQPIRFVLENQNRANRAQLDRQTDQGPTDNEEIIREINDHPKLRKKSAKQLLCLMIEMGEAPLVTHATEAEQRSLDATAKKLCKFFMNNSL
jgi:hypothetical protein